MFKCIKCNKEFKYESDYNRHKNRKTPFNESKSELDCELCKVHFKCKTEKYRHEKTKKHIINIQNSTVNNSFNHSFNNIINLTLNVNSFKKTDSSHIRRTIVTSNTPSLQPLNNSCSLSLLVGMVARAHHWADCSMGEAHGICLFFKHLENIRMHIASHREVVA